MKSIFLVLIFTLSIIVISCDNTSIQNNQPPRGDIWQVNEGGDSILMRYNDLGKLKSFTSYRNGKKNGVAKSFNDNGNVEFIIPYKDNLKHGNVQWFYENGSVYRATQYKAGIREGIQKKYYEDGKLMAEIPFEGNIVRPGLKEYNKSGNLKKKYPTLIIKPLDKIAFEGKYILRCYLSNKSKKAKFTRLLDSHNVEHEVWLEAKNNNGFADFEFYIPRGGYLMQKEVIRAEFKTSLSNTYVIEKTYNLAVDN